MRADTPRAAAKPADCPACHARVAFGSARTYFACRKCGQALMSNAMECNAIVGVAVWLAYYITTVLSGALLDLTRFQSSIAGLAGLVVVAVPVCAWIPRRLRVTLSPVRFKGANALDAGYVDRRPAGPQNLDPAALQKWAEGAKTFTRHAYPNLAMIVLGPLGLLAAVFLAFESLAAGGALALLAAACWAVGLYRTKRNAERYIRCPHCDVYPFAGYPMRVISELTSDGLCPGCGTQLPLDP